ncbi:T-cell immunoreceptor with Ig and ITIM domains [Spea bombifrons]|uniref:T-cell immunoreceptor with Ig and ITIM domains n=1 Tax=Spea bombifrons TaxID=233779 RepID=UPI00234A1D0E|nr:T-cell immunoreceptor with Ig and ITIM domains [Spea bombifrons]
MSRYRPPLSAPLLCCYLLRLTGVFSGLSLHPQNITATEGRDVTLRCEVSLDGGVVTQVNWQLCNNVDIASQVPDKGHVASEYEGRVTLEDRFGIKLLRARRNDSGAYCCTVNIFPHGRLDGKIFLQVTAQTRWDSYIWAVLAALTLLASGTAAALYHMKKSRWSQNATTPAAAPNPIPSAAGEEEEEDAGVVEYFNILMYRPPPI